MKRRPTRTRTTLAVSVLALTLIAPWALGQAPDAITEIRRQAEQGVASAQYNLGFMYEQSRGGLKDSVLTHMWYNIAAANGNEMAREARDNLEGISGPDLPGFQGFRSARDLMTRDEISRATELARTCMASNYQDCEQ